jgi:putative acetyltransferase
VGSPQPRTAAAQAARAIIRTVPLVITEEPPTADDVVALLERHLDFARATSPVCHVHALDLDGLCDPSVRFFTARDGHQLLGVGALRDLGDGHGEIKSMHTASAARGRGVGTAMVGHLLDVARGSKMTRISLETGTQDEFAPARTLYRRMGFATCPPFGDYTDNPYSTCMTLAL